MAWETCRDKRGIPSLTSTQSVSNGMNTKEQAEQTDGWENVGSCRLKKTRRRLSQRAIYEHCQIALVWLGALLLIVAGWWRHTIHPIFFRLVLHDWPRPVLALLPLNGTITNHSKPAIHIAVSKFYSPFFFFFFPYPLQWQIFNRCDLKSRDMIDNVISAGMPFYHYPAKMGTWTSQP